MKYIIIDSYQIIVILEGVVQGGDPLTVSIYQHIPFLPKTRRLKERHREDSV